MLNPYKQQIDLWLDEAPYNQVVIKRLLKQDESELNKQLEDFVGFYGIKPLLRRPYRGRTKGKVERTVEFVRDNFMTGLQFSSLDQLNGMAIAWCNKVNAKVRSTTNEIPFDRMKKEPLSVLKREYIIDKRNYRNLEKDCLISYATNRYSVPSEQGKSASEKTALKHAISGAIILFSAQILAETTTVILTKECWIFVQDLCLKGLVREKSDK